MTIPINLILLIGIHPLISQSVNVDTDSTYISWAVGLSIRN
jgi:hypothetical protein